MAAKGVDLVARSLALHEAVKKQLEATIHDKKNVGWDVLLLLDLVNDAWSRGLLIRLMTCCWADGVRMQCTATAIMRVRHADSFLDVWVSRLYPCLG